jgi:methanol metabolism-related c-type cytochrome
MDRRARWIVSAPILSQCGMRMICVRVEHWTFALALMAMAMMLTMGLARAEAPGDPAVASSDNGKYLDKDGSPTYKIGADGTVDWYTYSGYRRYHSDCHVCHGPNGDGSSYAPALASSMKALNYSDFVNVVTNGRKNVDTASDKVMPSFATNVNVMCFIDDIYVYLRARANNAIPGGRPPSHEDKPEAAKAAEASCTGVK